MKKTTTKSAGMGGRIRWGRGVFKICELSWDSTATSATITLRATAGLYKSTIEARFSPTLATATKTDRWLDEAEHYTTLSGPDVMDLALALCAMERGGLADEAYLALKRAVDAWLAY